jgi:3-oxoacyl-(acyl-carrier-protein) synthase
VAAALEALGQDLPLVQRGDLRLGMIVCVMSGCVNYSRRFYQETRENPATASPLVFPETVFNAPASHVSALLGIQTINYTLVGDPGTFLQGLALAADWITNGKVDGVLVAGAEESDWLIADAYRHFCKGLVVSDGAGALYLSKNSAEPLAELQAVTDSFIYSSRQQRAGAALKMAKQMVNTTPQPVQLFDSCVGISRVDGAELAAWGRFAWPRTSVKKILGEGLMAASAWQCVAAVQHLKERAGTVGVSVVGCNQQAIGCLFSS